MENTKHRKKNRLAEFDYSSPGAYFVTICAKDMKCIFGRIASHADPMAAPHVELTPIGQCVEDAIRFYNASNAGFKFAHHIVMPNHVHVIVEIRHLEHAEGERGRSPPQNIVRNLKGYVTKQAGRPIWQKSYHDHVIRDQAGYEFIVGYIVNNPITWQKDCHFSMEEIS